MGVKKQCTSISIEFNTGRHKPFPDSFSRFATHQVSRASANFSLDLSRTRILMMATSQLLALREWLEGNGGQLHAGIALDQSEQAGVHLRAVLHLDPETRICTVPNAMALSSLNALVDDDFTVFRNRGLPVEAIGYFYLMHQYINKETSFWKPYLDTLPGPEVDHGTPVWFDQPDTEWLAETDVLHTAHVRLDNYQSIYKQGVEKLRKANIDTEPYSW